MIKLMKFHLNCRWKQFLMLMILAVLLWYLSRSKRKVWKIQAWMGLEPWPLQCWCINIKIIVSICRLNEISLIWSHTSTIYRLIIDSHNDSLPISLVAQLEEHCTGIAEVRVWVPVRPFVCYCLRSIAKLRRSLTLKLLFPSIVRMKFH